jgi:hypothetical protein
LSFYPNGLVVPVTMSFETGEQATINVRFPDVTRLTKVRATVTKALAGTDAGTITVKNSAGTTLATLSMPASTAINTEFSADLDIEVPADGYVTLVAAKTTAGGKCEVFLQS